MEIEILVLVVGTALFIVLVGFIVTFVLLYKRAQLKMKLARQLFEQEILQAELEIRNKTLEDVGADLHDNVGQIAALTRLNIAGVVEKHKEEPELDASVELLDQLISEIRNLSHTLMDGEKLEKDLTNQIEEDLEHLTHVVGIELVFTHKLPPEKPLVLDGRIVLVYRIFQEGLANALKHANATRIEVDLKQEKYDLYLSISDNGKGIQSGDSDGRGMENIRSRVKLLDGNVQWKNNKTGGTQLLMSIPLVDERN